MNRGAAALFLALPAFTACASAASPGKRVNRYPASATTPGADEVTQILSWGDIRQSRTAPPDTLFIQAGRRLYLIGDIDGRFRDRSNPYDIYTLGRPLASDPLAGELQGVWAQPVKALDKYLGSDARVWTLPTATLSRAAYRYGKAEMGFQMLHQQPPARREGGTPDPHRRPFP